MKLQLVSRESKYLFGLLTKTEYAVRRDNGEFKSFSPHYTSIYWWDEQNTCNQYCWTTSKRLANKAFNYLTGNVKTKEYTYFIIEESEC